MKLDDSKPLLSKFRIDDFYQPLSMRVYHKFALLVAVWDNFPFKTQKKKNLTNQVSNHECKHEYN